MRIPPRLQYPISARRIGVNSVASWLEMGFSLLLALLLTRELLAAMGKSTFGLWSVAVGTVETAMGLDLGMQITCYRFLSRAVVGRSRPELQRLINSSFAIMLAVSAVLVLLVVVVGWLMPLWQEGLATQGINQFRQTMFILALSIPLSLLKCPFQGVLVGLQKSYLASLARVAGSAVFLGSALLALHEGLTDLRWIAAALLMNYLVGFLLAGGMTWTSLGLMPIHLRHARMKQVREMLAFSKGAFLRGVSGSLMLDMDMVLIGMFLREEFAAMYRIPMVIIRQASLVAAGVAVPLLATAAQLHAQGERELLRELYKSSTRVTGALALAVLLPMVIFGESFIDLWLPGKGMGWTWQILAIAAIGQAVTVATFPAERMLMGAGRIRLTAVSYAAATAAKLGAAVVILALASHADMAAGLIGLAWATTIPLLIVGGIVIPVYVCQQNDLRVGAFYLSTFSRIAAGGVVSAAILILLRNLWLPASLPEALVQLAAGGGVCLAVGGLLALTGQDRRSIMSIITRRPVAGAKPVPQASYAPQASSGPSQQDIRP